VALSKFEQKQSERIVGAFIEKRRPPANLREQVDLGFRVVDQSVEIFEIRSQRSQPEVKREHAVAKATYVKTDAVWRVFWQRQDLKWRRYDPAPEGDSLEAFLRLVDEDKHACFWG
jgi:hypothetical protein